MKTKHLIIPLVIGLTALTFTGCFGVDGDFVKVKSMVMNSVDGGFKKDVEFSVGSVGMSFARLVVSIDNDDEDAKMILKNISGAQIGVYKRSHYSNADFNFSSLKDLDKRMRDEDWQCVVKHVERNELTGVYIRYEDDEINQAYVINIDDGDLTIVRVEGDLENLIEYAIKEKGLKDFHYN